MDFFSVLLYLSLVFGKVRQKKKMFLYEKNYSFLREASHDTGQVVQYPSFFSSVPAALSDLSAEMGTPKTANSHAQCAEA